jgi:orotate phosphoribosyltransferase
VETNEVLDLLRESGALLEGHFELSSGLHSDRYFQCALGLCEPQRAGVLASALAEKLPYEVDLVVGPALGAVVWAQEMARALGTPAHFTERKDGEMLLRRGFFIEPGTRVLVVEDVITTGGSAREVVELLRGLGVVVAGVGTLVNRSGGNPFEDLGMELSALAEVQVETWEAGDCPLCAGGEEPIKPGSKRLIETGGGAG